MGYGDAGLKRTLAWGRRQITGTIISDKKNLPMININGIENGSIDLGQFGTPGSQAIG